jgi:hypothetical protein
MNKMHAVIISGVLILVATVIMGSMYTMSSISYSYVIDDSIIEGIKINNINTVQKIDTIRLAGPTIDTTDVNLELDLEPYETYEFTYDIVNTTSINYKFSKVLVNCLNDPDVNNYLTIKMTDGTGNTINKDDILLRNSKRKVDVTITYDKNVEDIKTFELNFDMDIIPSAMR